MVSWVWIHETISSNWDRLAENTSTNRSENNASPTISVSGNRSPTSHSTYLEEHEEESDDDNPDMGDDDNASLDPSGCDRNDSSEKGIHGKRKKKTRTVFSRAQVFQLESTFDLKRWAIDLVIYVLTVTNLIVRPQVPQFNRTRWTGGLVAFDRDAGEDLVPESSKQVEASTSGWTGSSQYGQYGTRSSTTGMWTGRTISHTYIHLKKGFLSVPGPSAGTVPRGCPQRQLCLAGPTASSSSSLLRTRLQSLGTSRVLVLVIGTSDPRSVPSGCQIMQLIAFFLLDNSLRGLPIYEYNCSLVAD